VRCWGARRGFHRSFSLFFPLFDFLCPFLGALIFNLSGKARAEGKGDPQRAARGRWTGYGSVSSAAMIYKGRTRCMKK
jgi:hypothetical protein